MTRLPFRAVALLALLASGTAAAEPAAGSRLGGAMTDPRAKSGARLHSVNIIDGADERDSLTLIGPGLGLSPAEIDRIRTVSGFVGCFLPTPSVGTGALFLSNRQILTAAHIFFDPSGQRRSKCFFRNQAVEPVTIDLMEGPGSARFGAEPPRPGSNDDFAIVRLLEPLAGAEPFPVEAGVPVAAGDALIVVGSSRVDLQACKLEYSIVSPK